MDIKAEKDFIKLELEKVEDIHLVEAIKNILAYGSAKRYENSLNPMNIDAFYERNEESRKAIEEGSLIGQQEAKAHFANKHGR